MDNILFFGIGFYCGWLAGVLSGVLIGFYGPRLARWIKVSRANKSPPDA